MVDYCSKCGSKLLGTTYCVCGGRSFSKTKFVKRNLMTLLDFANVHPVWTLIYLFVICLAFIIAAYVFGISLRS